MSRRDSRENAMKILYQAEYRKDESISDIYADSVSEFEIPDEKYVTVLVNGVKADQDEIDKLIIESSNGRNIGRISKLSLVIIRIALFEITKIEDVPYKVSINEALEISKKYDDPQSSKFINGVLNRAVTILGLKENGCTE